MGEWRVMFDPHSVSLSVLERSAYVRFSLLALSSIFFLVDPFAALPTFLAVTAGADAAAKATAFTAAATAGIRAAGYPAGADPAKTNMPMVILILTIMVLYVTMVYGPIAALLVELFPTRIRYTSMSLPYHIGNGWFGGLLPATAVAIVAQTGNMYNGLWYPIIFASITFVIGTLFIKETKDVDIYRDD